MISRILQLSRPNENNGSNYVIVFKRDPRSASKRDPHFGYDAG